MRVLIGGLACLLLSACVTPGQQTTLPEKPAAPVAFTPIPQDGKAMLASTMEVRVDTSAVGGIHPAKVGKRLAMALATITEFRPDTGTAVTPIRSSTALPDGDGGTKLTTVFNPNAFRQIAWMDDFGKVAFDRQIVDPGWYLVHSFGSTAGFEMHKPRVGQRACLEYGGKPAPGVEPVALRAGEVGYFGHFVITIAVHPSTDASSAYELSVADAAIEPAPPGLGELLRKDGLDPTLVKRIPSEQFPCPWSVPRQASS